MTQKTRVLLSGPVTNISGYSEHARLITDALMEMSDTVDLYIQNTQWANSTRSTLYQEKYNDIIQKTQNLFQTRTDEKGSVDISGLFDCTYQIKPPNEFLKLSPHDIGVTAALETISAPASWVSKCNMVDHLLVVSQHSKENLQNTKDDNGIGISTPITVLPFSNNNDIEIVDVYNDMNLTTKFNFLTVMQMSPRKNFGNLIKWFTEEYHDNEEVGLVIKTHMQNNSTLDFHATKLQIKALLNVLAPEKKCKIYLVHGNMTEKQMYSLYNPEYIDCYLTTTHGEGFGIPLFNAACSGIPVIATNWSGHLDYLRIPIKNKAGKPKIKSHFLKTKFDIAPVQEHHLMPELITPECEWAYPREDSFKKNMNYAIKNHKLIKAEADTLAAYLKENYNTTVVRQKYQDFMRSQIQKEENNEREVVYL